MKSNRKPESAAVAVPPQSSGSASFVRLFQPQFAPLVERGEKCQTVRPTPKRLPKPGDRISLRAWTGKPYRSKQRVLNEGAVTKVEAICVRLGCMEIDGRHLFDAEREAFARLDGFDSYGDFHRWIHCVHGLPFEGIVIHWQNDQSEGSAPRKVSKTERTIE